MPNETTGVAPRRDDSAASQDLFTASGAGGFEARASIGGRSSGGGLWEHEGNLSGQTRYGKPRGECGWRHDDRTFVLFFFAQKLR